VAFRLSNGTEKEFEFKWIKIKKKYTRKRILFNAEQRTTNALCSSDIEQTRHDKINFTVFLVTFVGVTSFLSLPAMN